ncbi:MAG: glycosyltransferase [Candidatus Aminicenantes bacterium]|nr:glycosyltransferase [Candidatus Aminicenantes bacterium]
MPAISIILPTYNERENIGPLIEQIYQVMGEEAEVVVVDDDSPDGTWAVVKEMAAAHPTLTLIRRKEERGLVSALRKGIARSSADVVAWLDCDLSMPPLKIKELYGGILQGYDVVIGSRFVEGGGVEIITGSQDSLLAFFLSSLLNSFIRRVLGSRVKDYTSGFVAVRRPVLEKIKLRGDYGEYFIELAYRAHRLGYRVLEIPYISPARRKGTSKTGTHLFHYLRRGSRYIWRTLKLKLSPRF